MIQVAEADPALGKELIALAAASPGQRRIARRALIELQARDLERTARDRLFARAADLESPFLPNGGWLAARSARPYGCMFPPHEAAMTDHVRLEAAKRIQIRAGGQPIVDTTRGYVVHEGGLPPRYYVPRDEVRGELSDGQGAAKCPWKGLWRHLDLTSGGARIANAAWTYYEPTPVCEPIRDFVAFYPDKVAIEVE